MPQAKAKPKTTAKTKPKTTAKSKVKSKSKNLQDRLFQESKKGSTFKNPKTGEVKPRSDFQRGRALGKAEQIMFSRNVHRLKNEKK